MDMRPVPSRKTLRVSASNSITDGGREIELLACRYGGNRATWVTTRPLGFCGASKFTFCIGSIGARSPFPFCSLSRLIRLTARLITRASSPASSAVRPSCKRDGAFSAANQVGVRLASWGAPSRETSQRYASIATSAGCDDRRLRRTYRVNEACSIRP